MLTTTPSWALDVVVYRGMCDASAAAALDADHFVVANDEDNTLRIYRQGRPEAVSTLSLASYLGTADDEESDIEGAAVVGKRIYWVTSHARNRNGKLRPARHRFFATDIDTTTTPPSLRPVARPYTALQADLLASRGAQQFGLAASAQRAPEADGGFNLEGFAATPDGQLLIGFRSPLAGQDALVMPLQNPQDLLEGRPARWGEPITLALGGRGVRSIEATGSGYLLVAGPPADSGTFALYSWSGRAQDAPVPLPNIALGSLRPEAMFAMPGTGGLQLLSDDGGLRTDGVECKQRPPAERSFRSIRFKP
ncbi:DUF3616 domain-containing protein [Variovorax sp. RT4R15]|uniref:DUF3616 domain-containing protein n=1 Tax=Variovorax sp. RT4R15 TaxID=3443737 RepID=UPI003F4893ED